MKTVVFDKTGTLTVGRPEVVSVVLFSTFPMLEVCDAAIAIEVSAFVILVVLFRSFLPY